MFIIGVLLFVITVYLVIFSMRVSSNDGTKELVLSIIFFSLAIIISGVFLIITSKNKNKYFKVQQDSVNKIDIGYGIAYLCISVIILLLLSLFLSFIYRYEERLNGVGYSLFFIVVGFVATLITNGFEYLISGLT